MIQKLKNKRAKRVWTNIICEAILWCYFLFLALILICRDGGEAAIFSAKGGVVSITLKAQHPAASIQAVEISSLMLNNLPKRVTEYYIFLLGFWYPYKRQREIIHTELFSTASIQYLHVLILGCSQDYISQVTITGGGSQTVALCPKPLTAPPQRL